MFNFKFVWFLIFIFLSITVQNAYAKRKKPLFESGLGTIVVNMPDYPASNHQETYIIPFPAAIYRGDRLRADDDGGARSRLFSNERMELNISFGLAPKARSENNPDRADMPNLETIIEIGPGLIYHFLKHSLYKDMTFDLSIPFRTAFTTDLKSITSKGFILNPFIYFRKKNFLMKNFGIFLGADAKFATKKNLENFYSVAPEFITNTRAQYNAKAGYLGTNFTLGLNYFFFNSLSSFIGYQYSSYHLASNKKSPLFKRDNNQSFVIGFIWWIYKSKEKGRSY